MQYVKSIIFFCLVIFPEVSQPVGLLTLKSNEKAFAHSFILSGKIVAPLHFVREACTSSHCNLEFKSQTISCFNFKLISSFSSVDLAILDCLDGKLPRGYKKDRNTNLKFRKGKVKIITLDRNLNFVPVKGRIKWNTRFAYVISTRLGFGSSGAPVLDQHDRLVGVVLRAENPLHGLLGKINPWHRFSVKAVKSKYILAMLDNKSNLSQIISSDLLDYYRSYVRNQSKLKRFFESLEFTRLINYYAYDFPETSNILTLREGPFWQKQSLQESHLFPLLLAYHLEKFGSFGIVIENLRQTQARELLEVYKSQRYFGQQAFFIGGILLASVIFLLGVYILLISTFKNFQKV